MLRIFHCFYLVFGQSTNVFVNRDILKSLILLSQTKGNLAEFAYVLRPGMG